MVSSEPISPVFSILSSTFATMNPVSRVFPNKKCVEPVARYGRRGYFGAIFNFNTAAMSISFTQRILPFLAMWIFGTVSGQQYSPLTPLKTVQNLAVHRNVQSDITPPVKNYPANGTLQFTPLGQGLYKITYTPDANFIGVDTFQVEYVNFGIPPVSTYEAFRVSVYKSIINANRDHAATTANTAIAIPALANDNTTASLLTLSGIPTVNHGTAAIDGDSIVFTPATDYVGAAHLVYRVCDSLGTCEMGNVEIVVAPASAPANSTFHVSTAKNARVAIPLSHAGYTMYDSPNHGSATISGGFLVDYTPSNNFTGLDTLVVWHPNGGNPVQTTVIITVLNFPAPNKYAIDDYAWTPKTLPITLNVKLNDIGSYAITGWINPNPNQGTIGGISNGTVTFTPNVNFSGVATFKYKLGNAWQPVIETGTVYVMVGNMNPNAGTFHLTTPMDQPLVINYQIPFIGFDFNIQNYPAEGDLDFYPGFQTLTFGNQTVSGNNLLVYEPGSGFSGTDEFDVDYCIASTGQCASVKVIVDVVEITSNPDDFCLDACVWAGDINNDGKVNNKDILPLGYLMGEEGTERPTASLEWYGQFADDWNEPYIGMPIDLKHADTDGNGEVNELDTTAIGLFYGKTHTLVPNILSPNKGLPFSLYLITPPPFDIGDLVRIGVDLGTPTQPVVNLYGFTFDMQLSPQIVDSLFHMDFRTDSWMNFNASSLSFQRNPLPRRLETALTHTNGLLSSGFGNIGEVDYIVIDIINDVKGTSKVIHATADMQLLGENGQVFTIPSQTIEIPIDLTKNSRPPTSVSEADLSVSPNPASDRVTLWLNGNNRITQARIVNVAGQEVWNSGDVEWKNAEISVKDLPGGIYFIHAQTAAGTITKKLEIIR